MTFLFFELFPAYVYEPFKLLKARHVVQTYSPRHNMSINARARVYSISHATSICVALYYTWLDIQQRMKVHTPEWKNKTMMLMFVNH